MVHTLQLIKFLYPFIFLVASFCLYRKDYNIMRMFYWKMVVTLGGRKLFVFIMLMLLIFINWCCCMTDPNWAVLFAALMTGCLFFYRVADRLLHRLHESIILWAVTLMLALVCYSIPYMNSIFHVLYTIGMASIFYPSERVLRMKDDTGLYRNRIELLQLIIKNYY